jgi:hypothetical protein
MPTKLLHERHKLVLFLDRDLHDYIRAVANMETFKTRRSFSMTQLINDLISEAISARENGRDPAEAAAAITKALTTELGIDNLDDFNQTKR